MSRVLKSILGKGSIQSLLESYNSDGTLCVKDATGKILFGSDNEGSGIFSITSGEEIIGNVTGYNGAIIANFLGQLLQMEMEKKKLGSEVLNLYKEINLIFNFSEKLARTIDALSICSITLDEAMNVIGSHSGVVVLWDDASGKMQIIASSGEPFFETGIINEAGSVLYSIARSGQSEILATDSFNEMSLSSVSSLIYSSLKVNDRVLGAVILTGDADMVYTAGQLKLLTTLALQASSAIESALLYEKNIRESKEREEAMRLVYEATGKFVPYEFIRSLGHNVITDVKLGDQVEKIVTVLFSDIRDYTTISEKMTPEENFRFVCRFNERMGPAIRMNNGFINQYLGDAIMAIFPNNAADALNAAVQMQHEVDEINKMRAAEGQPPIRIGVGMHTGPLIMGITGDIDRMDATTISDTVNTASRLESLTKYYKANIIISDASLNQINDKDRFHLRYLGLVQLKGKNDSLHIHECFSSNSPETIRKKQNTLTAFNEGIFQYINSSFDVAAKTFQSITELHPEDQTAFFFYDAAVKYMNGERRSGIVEMVNK